MSAILDCFLGGGDVGKVVPSAHSPYLDCSAMVFLVQMGSVPKLSLTSGWSELPSCDAHMLLSPPSLWITVATQGCPVPGRPAAHGFRPHSPQ